MNRKVESIGRSCNLRRKTGVELGDLAAKVLKQPHIRSYGLAKLGREVGVHSVGSGLLTYGYAPGSCCGNANASAGAFSNDQIKYMIHEAYAYYVVGNQLLSTLDA